MIVSIARQITQAKGFHQAVTVVVAIGAFLLGLEATPFFKQNYGTLLAQLDRVILGVFVLEIFIKLTAEGRRPWNYFRDGWNVLDFAIVAACLLPSGSSALAVFRLIRVLRILRLVTASPKLQIIVTALLKSIPSMGYVALLLFIHLYMYGVLGTFLFSANDPLHFGSLTKTLLTLFQVLTLEGWTDILRIQILGCDKFGYEAFQSLCTQPQASPLAATLYFITFIIFGTMIILNLLIGVVVSGMSDAGVERRSQANQNS